MIRDIVKHNDKEYQVTTVYFRATNIRTTEVRLIENGETLRDVVYHFVTTESGESQDKHKDILCNPEKYLSEEAIRQYLIDRRGGPMTNFRKIQSMSVEELAKWLDQNGMWDNSPWSKWFDSTYCQRCESVKATVDDYFGHRECKFAYCELEKKCRYFDDYDEVPDGVEMAKLWLEAEVE